MRITLETPRKTYHLRLLKSTAYGFAGFCLVLVTALGGCLLYSTGWNDAVAVLNTSEEVCECSEPVMLWHDGPEHLRASAPLGTARNDLWYAGASRRTHPRAPSF